MVTLWEIISRFAEVLVWWVIVAPWEGALRVRLGKHVVALAPGIHLRIPYVDAIYRQSLRQRITTLQVQTVSTRDGRTVSLCATVGYSIENLSRLYERLHHAEETVRNIVAGLIASAVRTSDSTAAPADIESAVNGKLDLTEFGLSGAEVKLVDFAVVRTFRVVQDQRWSTGDLLDTISAVQAIRRA